MAFTPPDLAQRRAIRAVQLRAMGQTYPQIAQALLPCPEHQGVGGSEDCRAAGGGCSRLYAHRSGAKRAVDRMLEQEYQAGANTREQLRRQTLAQIDLLLQGCMRDALGSSDDRHPARLAATRLLDRRAKLLGLDAPVRHVVTDELDEQIAQLVGELSQGGGVPAPDHVG